MAKKMDYDKAFRLITECRQSGMTDRQWCINRGLSPSTLYYWIKVLHKRGNIQLPPSLAKTEVHVLPKQEVVKVNIVPDKEEAINSSIENTVGVPIEIHLQGLEIRIRNNANASLITDTIKALQLLC